MYVMNKEWITTCPPIQSNFGLANTMKRPQFIFQIFLFPFWGLAYFTPLVSTLRGENKPVPKGKKKKLKNTLWPLYVFVRRSADVKIKELDQNDLPRILLKTTNSTKLIWNEVLQNSNWLSTNMDHNNMVYKMELRLSFSQQLAKGLRDMGHHLTDLYVKGICEGALLYDHFLIWIQRPSAITLSWTFHIIMPCIALHDSGSWMFHQH